MPTHPHNGFTLVELVMAILLISIVSVTVLPRFFVTSPFEQRAMVDDVTNALRYAQKLAIATNCQTQFQASTASYQVMTTATCNTGNFDHDVMHPTTNELGFQQQLNGVTMTAQPAFITFYPSGKVSSNGTENATIAIAGQTIEIDQTTGFIRAL